MKKKILTTTVWLLFIASIGVSSYLLLQDDDSMMASMEKTSIAFTKTEIDLGTIKQGVPKTINIPFTNKGSNPLMIYNVETSCGCTEAKWPDKPIKTKMQGEISVTYDAKLPGKFIKTITIYGNLKEAAQRVQIKGEVTINEQATLLHE